MVQLEEGVDFSSDRNPLENADKAWEERVRFKSTVEFVQLMDAYIAKLPEIALAVQDYVYESFTVPAEWIRARVDIYKRFPLIKRLEIVADDLYNRLERDNIWEEKLPHRTRIFISLKKMLRLKTPWRLIRIFTSGSADPKLYVPVKKGGAGVERRVPLSLFAGGLYRLAGKPPD